MAGEWIAQNPIPCWTEHLGDHFRAKVLNDQGEIVCVVHGATVELVTERAAPIERRSI